MLLKLSLFLISLAVSASLVDCKRSPSSWTKVLEGTHDLMKFKYKSIRSSSLRGSAGYLFFIGGAALSGETKEEVKVYMSWKDKLSDTYIVSKFPFEQVRFRLKKVPAPHVEFIHWRLPHSFDTDPIAQVLRSSRIRYVVVTIDAAQYKRDIRTDWE